MVKDDNNNNSDNDNDNDTASADSQRPSLGSTCLLNLHSPISENNRLRFKPPPCFSDSITVPTASCTEHDLDATMSMLKCCCGRSDCSFLEHNNVALEGLERDLETAARLGQALLDRHETYVKECEAERARLASHFEDLENEKTTLQSTNDKIALENRQLLSRLETLNNDLASSDLETKRLEDLLEECEIEIRRLNGLARRTQELEDQISDMEHERVVLDKQIQDDEYETRSTLARWKESERRVRALEDEVQRIEWESRVDREKHEEIVERMKRERTLERELGLSEGRLKATVAVQNMNGAGQNGKAVVSNFVRDILHDNANLQAGIAELRELLQASNEEVQNLRDQVLQHQPLHENTDPTDPALTSLEEQLSACETPAKQPQQEVHVHHHYHAKSPPRKERSTSSRRPSKRRAVMPSAAYSSAAISGGSSAPSTPRLGPHRYSSSPGPAIQHLQSRSKSNRWSMQSCATASTYVSSMASSPRSYFDRYSSIFDKVEREEESSRPTSPESTGHSSPILYKSKSRILEEESETPMGLFEEDESQVPDGSATPYHVEPLPESRGSVGHERLDHSHQQEDDEPSDQDREDLTPKPSLILESRSEGNIILPTENTPPDKPKPSAIHKSDQNTPETGTEVDPTSGASLPSASHTDILNFYPTIRPALHRNASHDSLVSISGMDIHLAKRPAATSTLTLLKGNHGSNSRYFAHAPSQARKGSASASQPLAAVTEFTAISRPGLLGNLGSSNGVHSTSIQALSELTSLSTTSLNTSSNSNTNTAAGTVGGGIGRLVGGWVRGKWGVAPTKSVVDLRSTSSSHTSSGASVASPAKGSSNNSTSVGRHVSANSAVGKVLTTNPPLPTEIRRSQSDVSQFESQPSTKDGRSTVPTMTPKPTTASSGIGPFETMGGRPPGINQNGPIPGFAASLASRRTPSAVHAKTVDIEILKESLAS